MFLYFAGPLFCQAELEFNIALTEKIEDLGYKVFLPQRDGDKVNKEPYVSMSPEDRARAIFDMDQKNLIEADIFLYILDGRVPDEGAAVALGIAYSNKVSGNHNKRLIGLHTDKRSAFVQEKLNPMIYSPLDFIADSVQGLVEYLDQLNR